MAGLLWLSGESPRVEPEDRESIFWLAVLSNTIYQFLFVLGLARTKAGNARLLMALTPVFAYVVGIFCKRETLARALPSGSSSRWPASARSFWPVRRACGSEGHGEATFC